VPPWCVEKIPGGFKVIDANGQSFAYVYSRDNASDAHMAKVLTEDEARTLVTPGYRSLQENPPTSMQMGRCQCLQRPTLVSGARGPRRNGWASAE
jgi:hypothetical protein